MFTMRNIVKNTFKLSYLLPNEETADAVDVEYWDNGSFQQKVVRSALPDSTETVVVKRQLFGCSSRAQAYREGMYMAAANRYRRRMVSLQTEMEGFIPTVGDLIAIQHDMPQWGQAGEVVNYNAGTNTLTLSEPANFPAGNYYIAFRTRNGAATEAYSISLTANPYQVILNETLTLALDFGIDRERTHYAIGEANKLYIEAKVLAVRPRSLERVEISAVVDSEFVYNADTGATPTESAWQLATRITRPVILGLIARSDPETAEQMYLSWQPAAGADRYVIEVSDLGNGWTRIGETSVSNFTAVAIYGARTYVRVAAVGATRGDWVEIQYGSNASYMWSPIDTDLMWNVDDTTPMWNY
jgi:predicted phage tail protein